MNLSNDSKGADWLKAQIDKHNIKYFDYGEFTDKRIVGTGGSGSVWKANWESRRMTVALKIFKTNADDDANKSIWREFIRELTNLRNVFYHPHINQFIGITKGDEFEYAMVLQCADGGNLRDYLRNSQKTLTWPDRYRISLEIAKGLLCLHAENIIHRDLHSKNVLVHQGRMLIADFGLSKEEALKSNSDSRKKGMPAYIDPQCNKNLKYKRSKKSDIFSLGMIFWEISSGKVPFHGLENVNILMKIAQGIREERVDETPQRYFELYTKCWNDDPLKRPDILKVVEVLENLNEIRIPTINLPTSNEDGMTSTMSRTNSSNSSNLSNPINPSNPTTSELYTVMNDHNNDLSV